MTNIEVVLFMLSLSRVLNPCPYKWMVGFGLGFRFGYKLFTLKPMMILVDPCFYVEFVIQFRN